jgi:hypothetical protein
MTDTHKTLARVHSGGYLYVSAAILNKYKKLSGAAHSAIFAYREHGGPQGPRLVLSWEKPHNDSNLHTLSRSWTKFSGYEAGVHYLCFVTANEITILTQPVKAPPRPKRKSKTKKKPSKRNLYQSFHLQVQDQVVVRLRDQCPKIPVKVIGEQFPNMTLGDLLRAAAK